MEVMRREMFDKVIEDMYQGLIRRAEKTGDTITTVHIVFYEKEHKKQLEDFMKRFMTVEQKVKE